MRLQQWRPGDALRKRRSAFISRIDVSGVGSVFVFFVALLMVSPMSHIDRGGGVDWPVVTNPKPQPGALKEDALEIALIRDGNVFFQKHKVSVDELSELLRQGVKDGSDPKVYFQADGRAKYREVEVVVDQIQIAGIKDVVFMAFQRAKH